MKEAQFGERQYETAANNELCIGVASPYVPTQPAEFYLGIDAAHTPQDANSIWRILSVNIPRRVQMSPRIWPQLPRRYHAEISGRFVSFFVQYKIPTFHDSKRAKYAKRFGSPYYQTSLSPSHQQDALQELEAKVQGLAVVRYAAPAFWSRADFDRHDSAKKVLENSAFASPTAAGKHRAWFYDQEIQRMVFNPEPEETDAELWPDLLRAFGRNQTEGNLRGHVHEVASAIGFTDSAIDVREQRAGNWIGRLQNYGDFPLDDIKFLLDLKTVAVQADFAGADWVVLVESDGWKRHPWPWHSDWYWPTLY